MYHPRRRAVNRCRDVAPGRQAAQSKPSAAGEGGRCARGAGPLWLRLCASANAANAAISSCRAGAERRHDTYQEYIDAGRVTDGATVAALDRETWQLIASRRLNRVWRKPCSGAPLYQS